MMETLKEKCIEALRKITKRRKRIAGYTHRIKLAASGIRNSDCAEQRTRSKIIYLKYITVPARNQSFC
jgi:hypothetical protein